VKRERRRGLRALYVEQRVELSASNAEKKRRRATGVGVGRELRDARQVQQGEGKKTDVHQEERSHNHKSRLSIFCSSITQGCGTGSKRKKGEKR